MIRTYNLRIIALVGLFLILALVGSRTLRAQTTANLQFPIADLGGCTDKDACRAYCDDPTHRDACFTFAQTHGLMSQSEVERARAYIQNLGDHRPAMQDGTSTGTSTPPKPMPQGNAYGQGFGIGQCVAFASSYTGKPTSDVEAALKAYLMSHLPPQGMPHGTTTPPMMHGGDDHNGTTTPRTLTPEQKAMYEKFLQEHPNIPPPPGFQTPPPPQATTDGQTSSLTPSNFFANLISALVAPFK